MENKQTFYFKIITLALLISFTVTIGLGTVLFANKKKFIEVEERTSRIELERNLEKIISPYKKCNNSLKGLDIPEVGAYTDMDQLTFEDGEIAYKSNAASNSLYIEQIRLSTLKIDTESGKTFVEISVPLRSKRSILIKLKTVRLNATVQKDSAGRVEGCTE